MASIRSTFNRIRRSVGRRGAFLLFLWQLDWIYAYGLAFPTLQARTAPTYLFLCSVMPVPVWAFLWFGVGTACLVYAFRQQDQVGYAAAMFIKVLWALVFFLGWIFADVERGYLSTTIWGTFAGLLWLIASWPEPAHQSKVDK